MQKVLLSSALRCSADRFGAVCAPILRRQKPSTTFGARAAATSLFSRHALQSQPFRWCSSSSNNSSSSNASSTPTPCIVDAVPPAEANPNPAPSPSFSEDATHAAYPPEVEQQIREWQERLKGLSPEDQRLIISSLLHPDQQKPSVMGGPGIGPKNADMVVAFTCGKCDFRMVKKFSKHAYTKGIVIVECPNCRVKHLLADNLGWLEDEARNIEDILREKGESFTRVGEGDYQVVDAAEQQQQQQQQPKP